MSVFSVLRVYVKVNLLDKRGECLGFTAEICAFFNILIVWRVSCHPGRGF